jgi:hypothetical protein
MPDKSREKKVLDWTKFAVLTIVQLWLTHAIAFFAHEYAHSATAWLLGWKTNPLALTYGHLTAANLLAMSSIDENVDYAPIFATGHGWQASIIAAAGVAIGNGLLTYPFSRWGYAAAKRRGSRTWAMLSYWLCVMSVGNLICYVPVRTFSFREDMHTVAQGFHCSPWWILLVLGAPFAVALVHFFARFEPQALIWIAPNSPTQRGILAFLTAFAIFGFFGLAGWSDSGAISHQISLASVSILFPLAAVAGAILANRKASV